MPAPDAEPAAGGDLPPLTLRSAPVRHAHALTRRRDRHAARHFLAEGPQAVREALRRPDIVLDVFVGAHDRERHSDLVRSAALAGIPVHVIDGRAIDALSDTATPQGLVARCRMIDVELAQAVAPGARLVVVLLDARDPGNAGTVLRTADAAGADAVVFAGDSVDMYNEKCVRASAGSLFHLPVAVVPSSEHDAASVVGLLQERGLRVLAADGAGDVDLDAEVRSGRLAQPTAWVFGNEAWGLPAATRELADAVVRVSIHHSPETRPHGGAESLNLAAAAAVCLYASSSALLSTIAVRTRRG